MMPVATLTERARDRVLCVSKLKEEWDMKRVNLLIAASLLVATGAGGAMAFDQAQYDAVKNDSGDGMVSSGR